MNQPLSILVNAEVFGSKYSLSWFLLTLSTCQEIFPKFIICPLLECRWIYEGDCIVTWNNEMIDICTNSNQYLFSNMFTVLLNLAQNARQKCFHPAFGNNKWVKALNELVDIPLKTTALDNFYFWISWRIWEIHEHMANGLETSISPGVLSLLSRL